MRSLDPNERTADEDPPHVRRAARPRGGAGGRPPTGPPRQGREARSGWKGDPGPGAARPADPAGREERRRLEEATHVRAVSRPARGGHRDRVHRRLLERAPQRLVRVRGVWTAGLRIRRQVRLGHGLAEFLAAGVQELRDRAARHRIRHGAHRRRLRALRRPPRPRLRRRPRADRPALLHQLGGAQVRARALTGAASARAPDPHWSGARAFCRRPLPGSPAHDPRTATWGTAREAVRSRELFPSSPSRPPRAWMLVTSCPPPPGSPPPPARPPRLARRSNPPARTSRCTRTTRRA